MAGKEVDGECDTVMDCKDSVYLSRSECGGVDSSGGFTYDVDVLIIHT